ncbi:MAG: hypothetical protein ACXADW_18730 [Candidatus Hodarchaeales archaeon]|jgi:hypothetical protein
MIGFLLENGNDQDAVQAINTWSRQKRCNVFSSTLIPSLQTNVMQRYEAFHFNGKIITDNFRLCQQLPHLGYCKKRYYYIQNYEWMNAQQLPYRIMKNTLLHPNIDLIVNDQSQVKLIEELTNKKVQYVMNNWDINVLRQIDERE